MELISPIVDIAIISFIMAIISQILQKKLIDRKKMKESQKQMKEMQKKISELLKQNDEKSKQEAARLQTEMLKLMNDSMKGSMKHMFVSLPIFFVVYAIIGFLYNANLIQLPFGLPVIHRDFSFEITSGISWIWWYIYCSLVFSVILSIILKIIDMKNNPSEKKPEAK